MKQLIVTVASSWDTNGTNVGTIQSSLYRPVRSHQKPERSPIKVNETICVTDGIFPVSEDWGIRKINNKFWIVNPGGSIPCPLGREFSFLVHDNGEIVYRSPAETAFDYFCDPEWVGKLTTKDKFPKEGGFGGFEATYTEIAKHGEKDKHISVWFKAETESNIKTDLIYIGAEILDYDLGTLLREVVNGALKEVHDHIFKNSMMIEVQLCMDEGNPKSYYIANAYSKSQIKSLPENVQKSIQSCEKFRKSTYACILWLLQKDNPDHEVWIAAMDNKFSMVEGAGIPIAPFNRIAKPTMVITGMHGCFVQLCTDTCGYREVNILMDTGISGNRR